MNLPNKLTVLRVCLIPFFVAALLFQARVKKLIEILSLLIIKPIYFFYVGKENFIVIFFIRNVSCEINLAAPQSFCRIGRFTIIKSIY